MNALDRAFGRVRRRERRNIDLDLERALQLASGLAEDLDLELKRQRRSPRQGGAHSQGGTHSFLRTRDRVTALDNARRIADELALIQGRDLDPPEPAAYAYAYAYADALGRARVRAFNTASALAGDRYLADARARAEDLCSILGEVSSLIEAQVQQARQLHRRDTGSARDVAQDAAPAGMAVRLLAQAVRVLPARDQERYRAEFDSELYELTEVGASRWQQVGHSLRVCGRVWALRRALLAPPPAQEQAQ